MTISSATPAPSYQADVNTAAKTAPKSSATPPAQSAPSAPVDSDGDHDGSLLNKLA